KMAELKFDAKGIVRVPLEKHPHIVLQAAANAAGAKEPLADQVKFDASRFAADGALMVVGSRGKGDEIGSWLASMISTNLTKHPAVPKKDGKPYFTSEFKEVDWKLAPSAVQKALAASTDPATRKLRADRAYFEYEVTKDDDKVTVSGPRCVVRGIRLGED